MFTWFFSSDLDSGLNCSSFLYAVYVLGRSHGLTDLSVKEVYSQLYIQCSQKSLFIAYLHGSVWYTAYIEKHGTGTFFSACASDHNRLNSFLRRCVKL